VQEGAGHTCEGLDEDLHGERGRSACVCVWVVAEVAGGRRKAGGGGGRGCVWLVAGGNHAAATPRSTSTSTDNLGSTAAFDESD
jgi:hypothetical protein